MRSQCSIGKLVMLVCVFGACASDDQQKSSGMQVDTVGDTIVIRPIGSGVWGDSVALIEEVRIGELDGAEEYVFGDITDVVADAHGTILVLDRQARTVRRYSSAGVYLGPIGRAGSGPGELGPSVSGMAFLPDGRLLVRDFQNNRINIYTADGTPDGQLPIPSGFGTSSAMRVDTAGNIYTEAIFERSENRTFKTGMLKLDVDGTVLDSIRNPFAGFEAPQLVASSKDGNMVSSWTLPYAPSSSWTIDHAGRVIGGISNRYAIDMFLPNGMVRRIMRDFAPVAVHAEEKANRQELVTRSMRRVDPSWRWNGPAIPDTKPPFRNLRIGADGRFWVQISTSAVKQTADPDAAPDGSGLPPLDTWIEPTAYDVFESDARFLGTVQLPERARLMYMRGDYVWAVLRDESDVPYVVRYRININASSK